MKREYDSSVQVFRNSFSSSSRMEEQLKQNKKKSMQEEMVEASSWAQGWWESDNQQWDIDWGSSAGIREPTVETEFVNRIMLCDYLFTAGTTEALSLGLYKKKIIQKWTKLSYELEVKSVFDYRKKLNFICTVSTELVFEAWN